MNSVLQPQEVKILHLFNKKTDKIIRTGFVDELKNNKMGLSLEFKFNPDGTGTISTESRLHDETKLDAVILTLRLFTQSKEIISITQIARLYQKMKIDSSYKIRFEKIKTILNNKLNEKAFTFLRNSPTYREVLKVVLYGSEAHVNLRETLEQWISDEHNMNMVQAEFERIVECYIYCIVAIKRLNEEILWKKSSDSPHFTK